MPDRHRIRAKIRSGRVTPTPKGVIVTGRLVDGLLPTPRMRCEEHLWLTHAPKRNPKWQSGWCQGATCLICGDDVPALDSSWWLDVASDARIRLAMRVVREDVARLKEVHAYLQGRIGDNDPDTIRSRRRKKRSRSR